MTTSVILRRAIVSKQDSLWLVSLHHEGLHIGSLPWDTFNEALASALRWTHP